MDEPGEDALKEDTFEHPQAENPLEDWLGQTFTAEQGSEVVKAVKYISSTRLPALTVSDKIFRLFVQRDPVAKS